ncbi:MAG: hypothetical protein LBR20_06375 [Propionibacteriaceae bacterium]|jgi:hypothetical protein|nr:hypothetical protein [Propionibacteriaceae bacterium]
MTLIITAFAALFVGVLRLAKPGTAAIHLGVLALMYLGAALMWCVDGLNALFHGEPFVDLTDGTVIFDDTMLGLSVLALGLIIWSIYILIKRARA